MDFIGTGKAVSAKGVAAAARKIGCDEAAVRAVLQVEAAGRGFDSQNRPKALFEPHKFYKHLGKGPKRDQAVASGLAYARWKPGNYPKSSSGVYSQIEAACAIDEDAALKSTSWGLGQIMGENHEEAGYATVQDFVEACMQGEDRQLDDVADLIVHWGIADEMARQDWAGFARVWNGPGYAKNKYDVKLASAYSKFDADPEVRSAPPPKDTFVPIAQTGMRGPIVQEVQELLVRAGHRLRVDGDFGEDTKREVVLFQLAAGLKTDGRVGPATLAALRAAPPVPVSAERAELTAADLKASGSTIVKGGDAITKIAVGAGAAVSAAKGAEETGILDRAKAIGDQAEQASQVASQVGEAATVASTTVQQVHQATGTLGTAGQLVADYWWVIAVVALVAAAYYARKIVSARVNDARTGKTL
jgi:hypothetical protein